MPTWLKYFLIFLGVGWGLSILIAVIVYALSKKHVYTGMNNPHANGFDPTKFGYDPNRNIRTLK